MKFYLNIKIYIIFLITTYNMPKGSNSRGSDDDF